VFTLEQQRERVLANFRRKDSDLEKYIFLTALLDRNETLFYQLVVNSIEEMLPIIYTPTVGEACSRFGIIYRRPRGLYVTAHGIHETERDAMMILGWLALRKHSRVQKIVRVAAYATMVSGVAAVRPRSRQQVRIADAVARSGPIGFWIRAAAPAGSLARIDRT